MRVETPQILWHNDSEGNGKPAPLYSVSLLPLSPTVNNNSSSSTCSSSTCTSAARGNDNKNDNGNSNSNNNTTTSNDSVDNENVHILATAGNSNEVHIWKVSFPDVSPTIISSSSSSSKDEVVEESSPSSQECTNPSKRQKILSRQTSSIRHTATLSRLTDLSINALSFSPCGTHLATAGDGGVFIVHTVPSHVRLHSSSSSSSSLSSSSSRDNSTGTGACTTSDIGSTRSSISLSPSQAVKQFWTSEFTSEKDLVSRVVSTHAEDIMDLSWSGCGKRIILGSLDHAVFVFEESYTHTHTHTHTQHTHATPLSVNGSALVSSTSVNSLQQQGQQQQHHQQQGENSDAPMPMAVDNVSPNGSLGANGNVSASASASASISTTSNGSKWTCVWRNTKEHTHYVQGVAFDPLGVYLASQGSDRTVRVWQRKRGTSNSAGTGAASASASTSAGRDKACSASSNGDGVDGANVSTNSNNSVNSTTKKKKKVLAVMDSNANGNACIMGNINGGRNTSSGTGSNTPNAANRSATYQRPTGKFQVGSKAKILKYRSSSHDSDSNVDTATTDGNENNHDGNDNGDDENMNNDIQNSSTAATASKKRYLFADESSVGSFFRRLAWTKDGAFLITPASLWQKEPREQQPSSSSSPSFATYLFARHQYDRPYKVLSGLEKPSVVVRPNPILFQLPRDVQSDSKENLKQSPPQSRLSPSSSSPSQLDNSSNNIIPYRSIFAVLTIDSILIYDTYHSRPLCIARGLHYAGLTDCTWTPDGRNLIVCSTDGYVSILSFAKGELGEEYVDTMVGTAGVGIATPITNTPLLSSSSSLSSSGTPSLRTNGGSAPSSRNVLTEAEMKTVLQSQNRNLPSSSTLPPCEPGQSATLIAPPSKKARLSYDSRSGGSSEKKRVVPTLLSSSPSIEELQAQEHVDGAEKNTGQGIVKNSENSVSMETDVVGAVTNLTIDSKLQGEANQIQQIY